MKYGLLEVGDTFQKGDEMLSPMTSEWSPVPAQWFGMKVSYDDSNTFSRFKIQCRRALKAAERQPTASNIARDEICPHYFEDTDGVHVVVVGQCRCMGKLSPIA